MQCKDVMKIDVETVRPSDHVHTAALHMRRRHVGFLPVVDERGKPVGTVTDRDLCLRVLADDKRASNTGVHQVMTMGPVTCHYMDDIAVAEERMKREHKSRIMVVDDDGHLVGVISLSDIAVREQPDRVASTLTGIVEREVHV